MAHKIDFKTFDGSYGVYTTPNQCNSISDKLVKLGFYKSLSFGNKSIWIVPYEKKFKIHNIDERSGLSCNKVISPRALTIYLNKLLKEGSDNQPK